MARIIVAPSADADTAEILAFLAANGGYGIAAKYNASFEQLYDNLADFPASGRRAPVRAQKFASESSPLIS